MKQLHNSRIPFYLFLLLLCLSAVSTIYLFFQGGFFFSTSDSLTNLHMLDPLQVKEVSFAEFLVNSFRNLFEILK